MDWAVGEKTLSAQHTLLNRHGYGRGTGIDAKLIVEVSQMGFDCALGHTQL